jgi:hypothetical protein
MPLLMTLLGALLPRIAAISILLFTDWFTGMFGSVAWPILGLLFFPVTLIWYSVVLQWLGGDWGLTAVVGLIISLITDVLPMRKGRAVLAPLDLAR